MPKGLLVMGVSGCGKSLSVKAIAECFGLPLYRIDMIEVFSGRHGNPDGAFVDSLPHRRVGGAGGGLVRRNRNGAHRPGDEAGTNLGRIFAFFLTWMQEKTRGLFVAATANRIDLLPAEMIRKGRFDEVFFIDLPTEESASRSSGFTCRSAASIRTARAQPAPADHPGLDRRRNRAVRRLRAYHRQDRQRR